MAREVEEEDRESTDEEQDEESEAPKKKKGKLSDDDKLWGMLAHLSPLVGLGIIGPLIIMLMYKDKSKFVEKNAKEALNFGLTMLIGVVITCMIGAIVIGPMAMVFHVIAGLAANKGEIYKYPMTIRFIK